jgi:hypothetical protein
MAKRLPYKGMKFVGKAAELNAYAQNELLEILKNQSMSVPELYRRVGLSLNYLNEQGTWLRDIEFEMKSDDQEDKKDVPAEQGKNAEEKQETI